VKKTQEKQQNEQHFVFNADNLKQAKAIVAKYPKGRQRSAIVPLLDIAQRQSGGWLPRNAIESVADFLEIPHIWAYEIATFYSMFNLKPVGKYFIQVCRTTPCWLRGSDEITKKCKYELGIEIGETTEDGNFTLTEVECLGACVNAPMVQINDDFYEDLSPEIMGKMLEDLAAGKKIKKGSQIGRQCSKPINNKVGNK